MQNKKLQNHQLKNNYIIMSDHDNITMNANQFKQLEINYSKPTHITSKYENKNRDPKNDIKPDDEFAFDEDSTSIATLRSKPTFNNC